MPQIEFLPDQRLIISGISVTDWAAWAPGIDSKEAWCSVLHDLNSCKTQATNEDPIVSFLPLALKKKLSGTTKIALWLANQIRQNNQLLDIPTVFSSRHGESHLSLELLDSIGKGEAVSPMSFGRSVHNFASGLYGIAYKSTARSTAISAREQSFQMGLIEACSILKESQQVLYIMADDVIPDVFSPYLNENFGKYGIAFLLSKGTEKFEALPEDLVPSAFRSLRRYLFPDH